MNKYLRAIITNYIYFAISTIFFLVITPVAIKAMGEEFYGLWTILVSFVLFSNIGSLGIDTIINKFASEISIGEDSRNKFNQIMTSGYIIVFCLAIIVSILLLLARSFVVANLNTSPEFKIQFFKAIVWIIAGLFPQFLARVPLGFLLSQLHNRTVRQIDLISSIFLWTGAVLITLINKNLELIAIWSLSCNTVIFALYYWAVQKKGARFQFNPNFVTLQQMIAFSGWMSLETIAITIFQQLDRIVVGFILGPSSAGVYAVGTSIGLRLTMITKQVTEVMLPYTSLNQSLGNSQKIYKIYRRLVNYVNISLAALTSSLIIWLPEILSIWISPEYSAKYAAIFRILVLAYGLFTIAHPGRQTLIGLGKAKFVSLVYLFSSFLLIFCVIFLSDRFGLVGAAWANCTMVLLFLFNIHAYKILSGKVKWNHVFADVVIGIILPFATLLLIINTDSILQKVYINLAIIGLLTFLFWRKYRDILEHFRFPFTKSKGKL